MVEGQIEQFRRMGNREVQEVEIIFPKPLLPEIFKGHRKGVFAQADFDRDFPQACRADERI